MLTLEAFLKLPDARAAAREAVGEGLHGLYQVLASNRYGGRQLAFDVTALVPGNAPIRFDDGYLDGGVTDAEAGRQDCVQMVETMREQGIASRVTTRVAAKYGMAESTPHIGNALTWLSEPGAPMTDEIALLVCCAGLSDPHNERYAELLAALVKCALLEKLAELNAAIDEQDGATAVVEMFRPGSTPAATAASNAAA